MRKITVEFTLPKELEEDYLDVCAELLLEDFLGHPELDMKLDMEIISDKIE